MVVGFTSPSMRLRPQKRVDLVATRKQKLRAEAAANPLNPIAKAVAKPAKAKKTSRGK